MADLLQAFIAFITDLFAALAAFLGEDSAVGGIVGGIGELEDVLGDLTGGETEGE